MITVEYDQRGEIKRMFGTCKKRELKAEFNALKEAFNERF